eukprot:2647704-Pleurochrysis_carterae.AAC.2
MFHKPLGCSADLPLFSQSLFEPTQATRRQPAPLTPLAPHAHPAFARAPPPVPRDRGASVSGLPLAVYSAVGLGAAPTGRGAVSQGHFPDIVRALLAPAH